MRWMYLRLKGYYGIKVGMDMDEIIIPFSKCKNSVCIIVGKNGSGKSTINKALSCMPDPSSEFTPNTNAEKEGVLVHDNDEYHFRISSPVDAAGNRKTNKAFICKNGVELNPNGNITSYKDIICSEFDLDANYIALTRLASDDRGLSDKTPSERKKFVSSKLQSLDTYNALYKNLSKRASVFRSHINGLTNKITNIGNMENANLELQSIDLRLAQLNQSRDSLQDECSKNRTVVELMDPDGSIQERYNSIANRVKELNAFIDRLQNSIENKCNKYKYDSNTLDKELSSINDNISKLSYQIETDKANIRNLISESEDISRSIQLKQQRIDNMKSEFDYDNLVSTLDKYERVVSEQKRILEESGFGNAVVSKEEYITIFQKLKLYKNNTAVALSNVDEEIVTIATMYLLEHSDIAVDIDRIQKEVDFIEEDISNIKSNMQFYRGILDSTKVLKSRPKECGIDSCAFISEALKNLSMDPEGNLTVLSNSLEKRESELSKLSAQLTTLNTSKALYDKLIWVMNDAKSNKYILEKLEVSKIFIDEKEYITRVINGNAFNEVEDCDKYIILADSIDGYNENVNVLNQLRSQMDLYNNKNIILEELCRDIEELDEKLKNSDTKIKEYNDSITFTTGVLEKMKGSKQVISSIMEDVVELSKMIEEKALVKSEFEKIKDDIQKIKVSIDKVNELASRVNSINMELEPLKRQRDDIKYKLNVAEEYQAELAMYQEKFNKVETLRKYCSPNTGIQTIFMSIYMNKTLSMANTILSMLFNGDLTLLPYVISADEFRIPVQHSSGLITDDVSSCSGAQIAMISMATTYSLVLQASPKYNIVRMDEVDSGLDTFNRVTFPDALKVMNATFGIDQCIMISHSIEISMSQVDLIILPLPSGNTIDYGNANVIFDYNDRRQNI